MHDRRLIEQVRFRVFIVGLPGMTPERERTFIQRCCRLASMAMEVGISLADAWRMLSQRITQLLAGLRTEQERESFMAIMQRLRAELFQDRARLAA